MTDNFIREVDEEYRRERITQIWNRFGALILGLALALIAAIGGWRYWQHAEGKRQEVAGARFAEAAQLAKDDKGDEAEAAFKALAADGPAGYRMLARFRVAAELGRSGTGEEGAKAYDALAADGALDPSLRDLARLRAAGIRIDSEPEASLKVLETLATPANAMRHSARELLGLAALRRGGYDAAARWFDQIAQDRATPQSLRSRLAIYSALAAGGPVQVTQ